MQMTNDMPIHRLNDQWQASIHYNWPMVGQYIVIFVGTISSFFRSHYPSMCVCVRKRNQKALYTNLEFLNTHKILFVIVSIT